MSQRPVILGLVGEIGAGKSTVASILRDLGCVVYDADKESRRVFLLDEVQSTMRSWWGDRVVNGDARVDRALVGTIVFSESSERERLEGLIHPRLADARRSARSRAAQSGAPACVIDAPLLFEAGLDAECDAVVCVTAPRGERVSRVSKRGWDATELERRESAQLPIDQKCARADVVLCNDGTLGELRESVEKALEKLLQRFLSEPG